MRDPEIPTSEVPDLLHAGLHEIGGSSGRIHRIATLLERRGKGLDEEVRSWLCHMASAAHLDVSLQAVRRYAEALDLPHERSASSILHVLHSASVA